MSRNDQENPRKQAAGADKRKQRLADALRANLKRRKAAAHRNEAEDPGKPDPAED
ncbi:MAG: hypothetical protein RIR33_1353 [Pseudomonadota bacterium]